MPRVAVVGSGPSGVYAVEALTRRDDISVDVIDRLPCPTGLVRYGVAPDHVKMKSIALTLEKVLERPQVRFLGNVEVGRHLDVDDLRAHYDAVVYAFGAAIDNRLRIPGEDLPGSVSATEFVAWYSGHPDVSTDRFVLDAPSVGVIGVGNVAVDVARVLVKPVDELRSTDMPDAVLDALAASKVEEVHIVGRRGPAQAKFTTKELRELGEIPGVDVVVDPAELVLDEASEVAVRDQGVIRRNLETLRGWAERPLRGEPRRLYLHFLQRPAEVLGTDAVTGLRLERTALDGTGNAVGTGETTDLPIQMLLRSVGYRGQPMPGLPFDERSGVIPHQQGRVLRDGAPSPGEYVVGWIKRGPTGVIGTNKSDAHETVAALLDDLAGAPPAPERDPDAIVELLGQRGADVVTWDGWRAIDAAEKTAGAAQGRERAKIAELAGLLSAAVGPRD